MKDAASVMDEVGKREASVDDSTFKVSHKDLILPMLASIRLSWPLWLAVGVGAILVVVGSLVDVRVALLGFLIWLAIAPMVMFFIYFKRALAPGVVPNLLPHSIRRVREGYEVTVMRYVDSKGEGKEKVAQLVKANQFSVDDAEVIREQTLGAYRVLYLSSDSLSVLYVPIT